MGAILGKLAQVMGSQKLFETGAVYAVNVSTAPCARAHIGPGQCPGGG